MTLAPIALFVYNRPTHTANALLALAANPEAKESDLHIFSDGPRDNSDKAKVEETREICRHIRGFKKVILHFNRENKGLSANVIKGMTYLFEQNESVICLEDDLVTSTGFLEYMNHALLFYRDKGIFSISAYSPPITLPKEYPYSTFNIMRNSSWGWATWRNNWLRCDWNVPDFKDFINSKGSRREFEQAGNDTTMMLLKQQLGIISSWSIRFNYAAFKAGQPTVYPVKSLIQNAGVDGSGTNMKRSKKYRANIVTNININMFAPHSDINPKVARSFARFYDTSLFRRIINKIKMKKYLSKT